MNANAPRYMVQEMGIIAVVILMVTNAWLLVSNMNYRTSEIERLKHIESTRFTANDGKDLRKLVDENRDDILRNREETLTNRKRGDEIIEMLKRLEEKAK